MTGMLTLVNIKLASFLWGFECSWLIQCSVPFSSVCNRLDALTSHPEINHRKAGNIVYFLCVELYSFGRQRRRTLPFSRKKKPNNNITLSASFQWCGSRTLKAAPAVSACERTNWLPGCLEATQLSAGGTKYSWRFACIHYPPCGKTTQVLFWEIVPLSSGSLRRHQQEDWCTVVPSEVAPTSLCCNTMRHRETETLKKKRRL